MFVLQDLLVNLMSSGTIQVHSDGESGQQYVALPLSLLQSSGITGIGGGGGSSGTNTGGNAASNGNGVTITTTTSSAIKSHSMRSYNGASNLQTAVDSLMKDVNVKTELNND